VYADGNEYQIPVVPSEHIADPPGRRCLPGWIPDRLCLGLDWLTCGRWESWQPPTAWSKKVHRVTLYPRRFLARYQLHFDDANKLDALSVKSRS